MKSKVNWNSSLFIFLVLFFIATTALNCAIVSDNMSPAIKQKIIVALDSYPKGYESWSNTASKVVLDKKSDFYGFQRVCISDKALSAYRNGGRYPQGSRLVLEFNEPVKDGADIVKGATNWIAVMTKDRSATETGGWRYEAYDINNSVAIKRNTDVVVRCFNCHTAMKDKDYIFSSPTQAK